MPNTLHPFTIKFATNQIEARHSIVAVISHLLELGVFADRCGDIEIALAEVVNNVVEHSCENLPRAKAWLTCWVKDNALFVKVSDPGRAMPVDGLPTGSRVDLSGPMAELPEGGFGWFLIRQIATTVTYDRQDGRNCLTLEFITEKKGSCHETALFAPNCRPKQRS